jgi:hypothetical protein
LLLILALIQDPSMGQREEQGMTASMKVRRQEGEGSGMGEGILCHVKRLSPLDRYLLTVRQLLFILLYFLIQFLQGTTVRRASARSLSELAKILFPGALPS